ncbi:glycosyltransferase family protein [Furfurilactobacillus entadae]|uniref:hypothetical protein n=1 Tax=Furfurilactobacillus entadae TaxID=2922307 RepID=UPI0038B29500
MIKIQKQLPRFFSIILIICLLIGAVGNMANNVGMAIFLVVALVFISARMFSPVVNRWPMPTFKWVVGLGLALMVLGQLFVLKTMPDTVFHDPYRILSQADQMAAGHTTWTITYFWRYPNNVPVAYLLSLWLRLTNLFGLTTNTAIHVLSLLCLDGFIVVLLRTLWQLSRRHGVVLGGLVFFALTPFAYTYYLQVFYTDLPTMFVLLVVMRTLWHWSETSKRGKLIKGAGLVLAILVGDLLKPNIIVLLPALAIVLLVLWRKKMVKPFIVPVILIIVGFGLSVPATQGIYRLSHYQPKTQFEFPVTNWMVMGTNSTSQGMYSGSDVGRAIQEPNKAARQKANLTTLSARIKQLGVGGLVKLWVVKLGILLNTTDMQTWYNGGFRSAPRWYQQHAQTLQVLATISAATASIVLWLMLGIRLLTWQADLTKTQQVMALIALVTALGYVAFHTLLWEVESRYGQAILPLLWVTLAAVPVPETNAVTSAALKRFRGTAAFFLTVGGVTAVAASMMIGRTQPVNTVVAAQRSQLSTQYYARPTSVRSGTVITENVDFNHQANYFSVQIHQGSHVNVSLTNLTTKRTYQLAGTGAVHRLSRPLPAGHYQIKVHNASGRPQVVDVVQTYRYQLAAHPLMIDGAEKKTASLVYTGMTQP